MRQNIQRRSKLTLRHRSIVRKKNRSKVVQAIGRTTTTIPPWQHTEEYDEDYEEERAIEYIAILDEEDILLHHSSWKRNMLSIDITFSPSIDTHIHQTSQKTSIDRHFLLPFVRHWSRPCTRKGLEWQLGR